MNSTRGFILGLVSGFFWAHALTAEVCKLIPLHTGVCQIGKDHVLGAGFKAGERMPFVIYAFLVEGPRGERALIDLGPKSLDYCNRMFRNHGFFRDLGPERSGPERYPDDIIQPHGNVFRQLKTLKVPPESIEHIVFIHVSKTGWEDNLSRRKDGNWGSYVDFAFSDFLVNRQREGKVRFEDNAGIFPGLRTVYLGGHSVCSQGVVVETGAGTAIITSDELYLYQLLEENIMPQIRTSETRYRAAIGRLVALAGNGRGILVPSHDPRVWQAFEESGPDWLGRLKVYSDRALGGKLRHRLGP